ncbi:MAG: HAD family hydrolase, partial [Actinomycetota bacterium]
VLKQSGIDRVLAAVASSDEVARGKPDPDVYLLATRRLGVDPAMTAAVEDSTNGLRSAAAAGLAVIGVPRKEFPPEGDALALASVVLDGPQPLDLLTEGLLADLR